MKVVILGSYPIYRFANELKIDPKKLQRVTSWNETLSISLSNRTDIEIHVITLTKAIKKTTTIKKGPLSVTFFVSPPKANLITLYQYTVFKVHKLINKINPDIVHGIGTEHLWPYIALTSGRPYVVTVHGILSEIHKKIKFPLFSQKRLFSILEKYVLKRTNHLISISPYVKKSIRNYFSGQIHPVENPISETFFPLIKNKQSKKNILFVGDIQPRKDLLTLIISFAKLKQTSWNLILVGAISDNSYHEILKKTIQELKIENQVFFRGFMLPLELRNEYLDGDMLVLPSIEETAPMCIAEAMTIGLPVIATNISGVPFMIEDKNSGFLFQVGNVSELGKKMEILIKSPKMCRDMGNKGREIAENRWHPSIIAEQTFNVYKKILKN